MRLTAKNTGASAEKENTRKKIQTKRNSINKLRKKLIIEKKHLNKYRVVKNAILDDTIFLFDGTQTDGILQSLSFDDAYKPYAVYRQADSLEVVMYYARCSISKPETNMPVSGASDVKSLVDRMQNDLPVINIESMINDSIARSKAKIVLLKKDIKAERHSLLDLKNELNTISEKDIVFNSKDITEVSNITKVQMRQILSGTALERFSGTYVDIEKKYGINAIAICSLSALESAWGTSRRAVNDHNYTGYGVYSDDSVGINAPSGKKNLLMTAAHLAKNYLPKGSAYYHGHGIDDVNKCYAASRTWAHSIEGIGIRLMQKVK